MLRAREREYIQYENKAIQIPLRNKEDRDRHKGRMKNGVVKNYAHSLYDC
jgi:hypothetical protein